MHSAASLTYHPLCPDPSNPSPATSAVLIHGPRQSGKTTLARAVGEPRGYRYLSFDDEAIRAAARIDPVGFVNGLPAKSILDEVQRVPEIFSSLKAVIDDRRTPGRFILTGSANVLFVPNLIDTLFRAGFKTGIADRLGTGLVERVTAGGYPATVVSAAVGLCAR